MDARTHERTHAHTRIRKTHAAHIARPVGGTIPARKDCLLVVAAPHARWMQTAACWRWPGALRWSPMSCPLDGWEPSCSSCAPPTSSGRTGPACSRSAPPCVSTYEANDCWRSNGSHRQAGRQARKQVDKHAALRTRAPRLSSRDTLHSWPLAAATQRRESGVCLLANDSMDSRRLLVGRNPPAAAAAAEPPVKPPAALAAARAAVLSSDTRRPMLLPLVLPTMSGAERLLARDSRRESRPSCVRDMAAASESLCVLQMAADATAPSWARVQRQ
jgi:hypothetical protein